MKLRAIGNALRFALLLLTLALSACTAAVGTVVPRPTISLAPSTQRLALALSPTIADAIDVPYGGATVRFTGLRASLGNGFAASMGRYYAPAAESADLILRFESVAVELVPHMVVRFAARLDDRAGRTLGRSFGTLKPTRGFDFAAMLEEALALMFEKVAADCFVPLSITR